MRKDQRESHKDLGETELEQSVLRPIPLEANRLKKFLFPVKLQVSFCPQWKETQFTFYISTEHTKQDDLKKKNTQIHCGQVIYILSCSFRLK